MVTRCQLLAHTLIPAQPPLPVFSFLLPVVPPECMPKLQLSAAKSQKLMQEKETAICKKTTKNMFCGTLVKYCDIAFAQSCSSNRNETLHRMPESFWLCFSLLAYAHRMPCGYQHKHVHKFPKVGDSIPAAAPLLQLLLLVLVQPSNMQHSPSHRLKLDFF